MINLTRHQQTWIWNTFQVCNPKDGPEPVCPNCVHWPLQCGKILADQYAGGRKNLARISSNPGKTRTITISLRRTCCFTWLTCRYGYAKLSKEEKAKLEQIIRTYILKSRHWDVPCPHRFEHEPLKQDAEFMTWMISNGKPFVILFTKTDKFQNWTENLAVRIH